MVSFWPFRRNDTTSAASFEKTLSQLSAKINRYSTQVETFRSKQRRYKALLTLYAGFSYILVAAILTLVTGWDKWGAVEYTAVAGGPVAIVGLRWILNAWYEYRIKSVQSRLQDATKEREKVIEKLKIATKYDSTQQLLDKYGGGGGGAGKKEGQQQQQDGKGPKRKPSGRQSLPAQFHQQQQQGARTGFAPPPTANIAGRQPPPASPIDARIRSATLDSTTPPQAANESFAPNAFPSHSAPPPQQSSQYAPSQPAWYDRIMDVILGEDETQAKNRIALICSQCRLVNGQAPPGVRSLEDVGRWRCKECGTMNGVESEVGKVLQQAEKRGIDVKEEAVKAETSDSSE